MKLVWRLGEEGDCQRRKLENGQELFRNLT